MNIYIIYKTQYKREHTLELTNSLKVKIHKIRTGAQQRPCVHVTAGPYSSKPPQFSLQPWDRGKHSSCPLSKEQMRTFTISTTHSIP